MCVCVYIYIYIYVNFKTEYSRAAILFFDTKKATQPLGAMCQHKSLGEKKKKKKKKTLKLSIAVRLYYFLNIKNTPNH